MSGYVGDLSPQQEAALQKLKEAVSDIHNLPDDTDHFFLRWLRARKFDLQKSETMLRNHMEYRKKYGADTILTDYTPPEVFRECLAGGFFGEDLDGHPVWYDNIGNADPRGLYRSISGVEEVIKFKCLHHVQLNKLLKEVSEKKGRHIETVTVVIDFKNLNFQRHYYWPSIEIFKELLRVEEANNPERTKVLLLINTPGIFPFCYNIVKHVLDEKTRKKVVVLGQNCNLKEELQKYISLDQLPGMYGGNRFEPDAECSNFLNVGRDVPPKYYLTNQTETSKNDMERVLVGRGSFHKERLEVVQVGSRLRWEFFSTDYDISFGVSLKRKVDDKKEKVIICPFSRAESHLFPQSGQHSCSFTGEYVFKFDNSYSWTRSKEIFYSIKVLPPHVNHDQTSHTQNSTHSNSLADGEEDEFFECDEQINGTASPSAVQ